MTRIVLIFLLYLQCSVVHADDFGRYRLWNTLSDEVIKGAYIGTEDEFAALLRENTSTLTMMPIAWLTPSDQTYLKNHGWPLSSYSPRNWKQDLAIGSWEKHYRPSLTLNAYESEHFRVYSEMGLSRKTWEKIFDQLETFYTFMQYSPWGIAATPNKDKFHISIAENKASYYQAGGLIGSQGVYLSEHQLVITYAEAMRINEGITSDNVSINVLSHELTHQLMDDYINLVPPWVAEGIAKYFEMFPITDGSIQASAFDQKAKEYHLNHTKPQYTTSMAHTVTGLKSVFRMDYDKWQRGGMTRGDVDLDQDEVRWQYHKAFLLVYYLLESPQAEYGKRLMRYLEARKYQVQRRNDYNMLVELYNAEIMRYNQALQDFGDHPDVKVSQNPQTGALRYHYPETMSMPQAPNYTKPVLTQDSDMFNHLGLLYSPDQTEDEFFMEVAEFLKTKGF